MKFQSSCIQAVEFRLPRHVGGQTLPDRRRNADIRLELHIMSIINRTAQYRLRWFEHFNRMDDSQIPNQLLVQSFEPKKPSNLKIIENGIKIYGTRSVSFLL